MAFRLKIGETFQALGKRSHALAETHLVVEQLINRRQTVSDAFEIYSTLDRTELRQGANRLIDRLLFIKIGKGFQTLGKGSNSLADTVDFPCTPEGALTAKRMGERGELLVYFVTNSAQLFDRGLRFTGEVLIAHIGKGSQTIGKIPETATKTILTGAKPTGTGTKPFTKLSKSLRSLITNAANLL